MTDRIWLMWFLALTFLCPPYNYCVIASNQGRAKRTLINVAREGNSPAWPPWEDEGEDGGEAPAGCPASRRTSSFSVDRGAVPAPGALREIHVRTDFQVREDQDQEQEQFKDPIDAQSNSILELVEAHA